MLARFHDILHRYLNSLPDVVVVVVVVDVVVFRSRNCVESVGGSAGIASVILAAAMRHDVTIQKTQIGDDAIALPQLFSENAIRSVSSVFYVR